MQTNTVLDYTIRRWCTVFTFIGGLGAAVGGLVAVLLVPGRPTIQQASSERELTLVLVIYSYDAVILLLLFLLQCRSCTINNLIPVNIHTPHANFKQFDSDFKFSAPSTLRTDE